MGPNHILNDYILEVRNKPFEWGVHDCFTFTNEAYRRLYGEGWAEDWLGKYMTSEGKPMTRAQLKKEFGFTDFTEAVATKLTPISFVPPRGALIATKKSKRWSIGYAMGICMGTKGAFLSDKGVVYLPLDEIDKSWVK